MCRDMRIGSWIPRNIIDGIENAGNGARPCSQNALQSKTVLGGLDLLAISPAHRRDEVRHFDGALQKIHLAVEFHLGHGEQIPRQHEQWQDLRLKKSLVSEIVNGEDA